MAVTATVAYHRERAEQERRRAKQAIDSRSKSAHIELALAHGRAAMLGRHRLRAAYEISGLKGNKAEILRHSISIGFRPLLM